MVSWVATEHDKNKKSVSEILERDMQFYSLRPYLSKKVIGELARPHTSIAGSTIPSSLKYILDEIDELENKWGLSKEL